MAKRPDYFSTPPVGRRKRRSREYFKSDTLARIRQRLEQGMITSVIFITALSVPCAVVKTEFPEVARGVSFLIEAGWNRIQTEWKTPSNVCPGVTPPAQLAPKAK